MELYERTASELSRMLRNGECSALEIARSQLEQICRKEEQIGAYITVTEELALRQAEAVDAKRAKGEPLGLLEIGRAHV